MAKIMIIEDHENLRLSLNDCLSKEGYQTELAENLSHARLKTVFNPDLIILDWMLPDGQGLDFLRELRQNGNNIPIIFLTARVETVDKVLGLELGANDYITKPFEPRELLARIRVQLRNLRFEASNKTPEAENLLQVGSLSIDRIRHKVFFNQRPIELVKKEFDLLVLFSEDPEKVFTRDEILNKVWGYDVYPTTRTVDTHIMQLRQKIHENLIETVRAVGYRMKVM